MFNKLAGYVLQGVSTLCHLLGNITQPDHFADKIDESGLICRRSGHDWDPNFPGRCRRCKRVFTKKELEEIST